MGKADGAQGDALGIDQLADDLEAILPCLLQATESSRCILFGHSMGGLVVSRLLTNPSKDVSCVLGAIISSPAFLVHRTPLINLKISIGRLVAKVWPTLTFRTGLDPAALSRDPEVVERYRQDPLVHDKISARLGRSLIDDGQATAEQGNRITVPILLYHGTADRIAAIDGTRRFAAMAPKSSVVYRELDGYYHEPHNEPSIYSEELFAMLREWIVKQSAS